MSNRLGISAGCLLACCCLTASGLADDQNLKSQPKKYLLRYHFQPAENLCWNVVQRCQIRTTVGGTTQTAETTTTSVKAWRVNKVERDGAATFTHLILDVDMRNRLTGRDEVHYNSNRDLVPPRGFEQFAKSVNVPLATLTVDSRGREVTRKKQATGPSTSNHTGATVPLPDEAIAIGEQWSFPHDIEIPQPGGAVRRVKAMQTFTLESVKNNLAVIRVATQILTPVHDPALESQLLQFESSGTIRFDIEAGQVRSQQMDVDKAVVGFRGEASSIHYLSRSTEQLLPAERSAARTNAKGSKSRS